MGVPLFVVDAFASRPFTGNPAAVSLLDEPADDAWMQSVAAEMSLSETAFVRPLDDDFELRWFTPTTEVELCGHATLASAHVLWEAGRLERAEPARFHTRFRGLLSAECTGDAIELDFPADPPEPASLPDGLADALGVEAKETMQAGVGYLIEVADEDAVRGVHPEFARLAGFESVIVTSAADGSQADFVSRYFAPRYGIDEDPVTGAAHCALGPYWAARLGRDNLVGYQASARGGTVAVRVEGGRVRLGGRAVTVVRGELAL
ncbi:MAG: PhzF family phenazine biosynthesis protein [Actinobacteria bacterium]|nr:PhzF family phenazine biosynthesis protein [Actinomycetota bacterium]